MNPSPKPHLRGYKFPLFKPEPPRPVGPVMVPALDDGVIDTLVCMAMDAKREATPKDKIRYLVRLVEAELQAMLAG